MRVAERGRRVFGRRLKPVTSLNDFTVTVVTALSGSDKLVLHLDRKGQKTLAMQIHKDHFMWLLDDPEQFVGAYEQRANWVDPYKTEQAPAPEVGAQFPDNSVEVLDGAFEFSGAGTDGV